MRNGKKIIKDIQDLQVSYVECSEAVDASYERRIDIDSRLSKIELGYEKYLKRRNGLIIDGLS